MRRLIAAIATTTSLLLSIPAYAEPIPGETPREGFLSQMYADADVMNLFEVIPLDHLAPKTMLGMGQFYCQGFAGGTTPTKE